MAMLTQELVHVVQREVIMPGLQFVEAEQEEEEEVVEVEVCCSCSARR